MFAAHSTEQYTQMQIIVYVKNLALLDWAQDKGRHLNPDMLIFQKLMYYI